jgi:hypothetical protein
MINASTPISRHYDYLCQLIQKMEGRFGPEHDILNPLHDEVARFDKDAPPYLAVQATHYAESSISVMERMWASRSQKMDGARQMAPNSGGNNHVLEAVSLANAA